MSRRARSRSSVLGEQAIHLVRETAKIVHEMDINRVALRRKIEKATRPAPGTSDLLGRPMRVGTSGGIDPNGKLRVVDTYDLVGMAPIHLKKGV
jgi:hypothetical protein